MFVFHSVSYVIQTFVWYTGGCVTSTKIADTTWPDWVQLVFLHIGHIWVGGGGRAVRLQGGCHGAAGGAAPVPLTNVTGMCKFGDCVRREDLHLAMGPKHFSPSKVIKIMFWGTHPNYWANTNFLVAHKISNNGFLIVICVANNTEYELSKCPKTWSFV